MAGEVRTLKALKILVYGMAVLLVVGFSVLIWGMVTHGHGGGQTPSPVAANAQTQKTDMAAGPGFGSVTVPLPVGGRLEQVVSAGPLVVARVSVVGGSGSGGDRLLVLDPAKGAVVGEMILKPDAP